MTTSIWNGKEWVNMGVKLPDRILMNYSPKYILANKAKILKEVEEEQGRASFGANWRSIAAGIGDQ